MIPTPVRVTVALLCLLFPCESCGDSQTQVAASNAQPQTSSAVPQTNDNRATKDQVDAWMTQLSNWGRWGPDDQLGAVNLITPAKRQQAVTLAKTGTVVSLAHDLILEQAADAGTPFKPNLILRPDSYAVLEQFDAAVHGITFTHVDALCHETYQGKMYNGNRLEDVATKEGGCAKLAIGQLKDRLVTRGILLDIPRLKGLPYFEPKTHVYREDIEAWERQAGVKIAAGDAIFLRTGRWARRAKLGPFPLSLFSGYDASVVPFLKERDVALLGGDTSQDVGTIVGFPSAVHRTVIVALGVNIIDNMDLEALAETAARLKRWEFLFVAGPLASTKGSGSLLNPIAIF